MNITQESEEQGIYELQQQIDNIVREFTRTKNLQKKKELNKQYKTLIKQHFQWTKTKMWKESL